ncbi:MAG: DUF2283 domain-containing protein [Thermoplasmata archaeon]
METEITSSGVILDYDKDGKLAGIEINDVKNQFSEEELSNIELEISEVQIE